MRHINFHIHLGSLGSESDVGIQMDAGLAFPVAVYRVPLYQAHGYCWRSMAVQHRAWRLHNLAQ